MTSSTPSVLRPVPGTSGYFVADDGSLFRARPDGSLARLKPVVNPSNGYAHLRVRLANGRERDEYIHTMVLEAFVGPRPEGAVARHLDGSRLNNSVTNLTWGSVKENAADAVKHGRTRQGEKHPSARLSEQAVKQIRFAAGLGVPDKAIAGQLGVSVGSVRDVRLGRTWGHVR